jgi:hypothetical protein
MSKKSFILYLSCILLFVICVLIKQHSITKKNEKPAISYYSSWNLEGKPINVHKVQKKDLETTWKMNLVLESENTYVGYVPKAIQSFLSLNSCIVIYFPEKKVNASLTHVGSCLHEKSGMYPVKVLCLENLGKKNQQYLAEVVTTETKDVLLIPFESVHMENGQPFVWSVNEGKIHKKNISLGERNKGGILATGIEENDLIVQSGPETLKENDLVKINDGK